MRLGWGIWLALLALVPAVRAQDFVDAFASRVEITGLKGTQNGSTVGASIELDEPRHGGKYPSHSMWVT